jgi:hypothetical protein
MLKQAQAQQELRMQAWRLRMAAELLLALFSFPLCFLLSYLGSSLQGGLGFGQRAGGLLVDLDVTGQLLPEFRIEFLARAGTGEWCTESRVVVGLSMGDYVYTKCPVIHLGHCDEHSAAGKKGHEFGEHRASFRVE